MRRILHCVERMDLGGLETMIMNLYRSIDKDEIQFDFLTLSSKEGYYDREIAELGGNIYRMQTTRKSWLKNKRELNNFFINTNYKVIHFHVSSLSNMSPLVSAKHNGINIRIMHVHSMGILSKNKMFHKVMHYKNFNQLKKITTLRFACSKSAGDWAYSKNGKHSLDYTIIKNSIDSKKYKFDQVKRQEVRAKLGIKDELVIGHIGRFHPVKNHKFLIDTFFEIKKTEKNAKLLLIGEGILKQQLEEQVRELKLTDDVLFLGLTDDVASYLQAIDLVLFPSIFEGLGLSLIEAQAASVPCLISDSIPEDVIITHYVKVLSLHEDISLWSAEAINLFRQTNRVDRMNKIVTSGYDSKRNSEIMKNYYLN